MRLKRIELVGFKSFLDKTVLTFPENITAIVGPNGCGKSNLVDAVLWALGEMRTTHLRGRSMEDVIFNGTEELKPSGMAEVSLVLSPDEGSGDEVIVTRRLFRSGESQYLINRTPCRLKDIRDFFLGTGLGTNSYAIVEQGQVETLINSSPLYLRQLVEEAAGVSKYKEKKKETLQKMERTRQNLLRLQDVLEEVKRQLDQMRRQASRAKRYKRYQEELQEIELRLATHRYAEKLKEAKQKREELRELREKVASLQKEAIEKERGVEELRLRLMEEEESLGLLRDGFNRLQASSRGKESEHQGIEREEKTIRGLIASVKEELEKLGGEEEELKARREGLLSERKSLELELRKERELLEEKKGFLEKEERGREEARLQRERIREKLFAVEGEIVRLGNLLKDRERRLEELEGKKRGLEEEISAVELERRGLKASFERIEGEKEEVEREVTRLRERIMEVEEELLGLQEEIRLKEEALRTIEGELGSLRMRQRVLKEMESSREGYGEGVRAILEAKADLGIEVLGILADQIEVREGYEGAVEAALGERLTAVVVRDREDALKAISYLRDKGLGRGCFLPLKDLTSFADPPPSSTHGRDIREVIEGNGPFRFPISALLNGVRIVEDLKDVPLGEFVTPEGDRLDAKGVVMGGAHEGVLMRKRELRRINEEIEAKEGLRRRIEGEIRSLEERLQDLEERLRQQKEGLRAKEERVGKLQEEASRVRGRIELVERKRELLLLELKEVEAEREALERERRVEQRELSQWSSREEALKEEMERWDREFEQRSRRCETLREEVATLGVRIAAEKERLKGMGRMAEELAKQHSLLGRRRGEKEEQLEELKEKLSSLRRRKEEVREELSSLLKEVKRAEREVAEQSERINELKEKLVREEGLLKGLRGDLRGMEELEGERRLELSRLDLELRHEEERAKERFGLSLSERSQTALTPPTSQDIERSEELRRKLERLGEVYPGAIEEYEELKERWEFLSSQKEDLERSLHNMERSIERINRRSREKFSTTFKQVAENFQWLVGRLFPGGKGELVLEGGDAEGVKLLIQPHGKRLKTMELLSGGEKALAAIAFIFSLTLLKPAPFYLLDEVDASLDDANLGNFLTLLKEMGTRSQFILITHNKATMEAADILYGITMEIPGVSKVVSVRMG